MKHESGHWSPEERARIGRLPRERAPDPRLKARIKERLRIQGAFGGGTGPQGGWWLRAATAGALVLAGAIVGRRTVGEPPEREAIVATQPSLAAAEQIQHAGTRYVETLASLVTVLDSVPVDTGQQGREAAMSALRGAAEQVVRLPGHDDRTEQLLRELRALRQQ